MDPNNPKTWREVEDLQPRLKTRLRLGGWIAWHVRKQGDREHWGDERQGARRAGIIESVPIQAAWGMLDWICVPTTANETGVLWIELKSEKGKLTEQQALNALHLAQANQEVVVLRPRHFFGQMAQTDGAADMVAHRLVEHIRPTGWEQVLVLPDMDLGQVLRL